MRDRAWGALRVGEALSLRYEDLDLIEGTVSIRRTLWRGRTYSPKTSASAVTIKIPAHALDALRRHAVRNGSPEEDWLLPTKSGNPVGAPHFHTWGWKWMLRKAGLPELTTFHSLRRGKLIAERRRTRTRRQQVSPARQPRHHHEGLRAHDRRYRRHGRKGHGRSVGVAEVCWSIAA